jgi:hypothetical protein
MTWEPIKVSSKILGHISAGVYRSAGGAIKELVSNAFDADATKVVITTNWPSFDIVTCRDNGSGMALTKFKEIMSGGIGDSKKRVDNDETTPRFRRPIIGRLGIGMLGIAQICHSFKIVSHHSGTQTAFEGNIKLADHLREKMEGVDPEQAKTVDVGQFDFTVIPYDAKQTGTWIITTDMRSAVIRKFREKPEEPLPSLYPAFLDLLQEKRATAALGDYWQMVWELCIACPIAYIDDGPCAWAVVTPKGDAQNMINEICQTLQAFNFDVIVDGLSLRKPNTYPCPNTRAGREKILMTGQVFPLHNEIKVYGRLLRFSGYIYLQDGQAVQPMDLRGLLIRIRNVAIGNYDAKLLGYRDVPNPRFNWLSGEIYVQEGLEQALNIDRDSFNQTHEHFVALQNAIHNILLTVFLEARSGMKTRSETKADREQERLELAITRIISEEFKSPYSIKDNGNGELPIEIDSINSEIIVNSGNDLWPRSKSKRELARLIGIAYEISLKVPENERRTRFYMLLTKILEEAI